MRLRESRSMVDSDRSLSPRLLLSPSSSFFLLLTSSLAASTASRNLILAPLGAAMGFPVAPSYARARLIPEVPRATTNDGGTAEVVSLASPSEAGIAGSSGREGERCLDRSPLRRRSARSESESRDSRPRDSTQKTKREKSEREACRTLKKKEGKDKTTNFASPSSLSSQLHASLNSPTDP